MDGQQLKNIVEAALFAADGPLGVDRLIALFEEGQQPTREEVRAVLKTLDEEYAGRGVELKEVASGFRFQARAEVSPWVGLLWDERPPRYSRALLETLALIAYRQPITRAEIEEIRGVTVSSNIVKTLLEREWVRVVGHRDVPGKPAMYATTRQFLDYFNLKGLGELPTLAELRDYDKINAELDLRDPGAAAPGAGDGEADAANIRDGAPSGDMDAAAEGADREAGEAELVAGEPSSRPDADAPDADADADEPTLH